MPKYQLILETREVLTDQEFEERVREPLQAWFDILEARNLEGIREEVWQRKPEGADLI
jgi:hypothetical protein